ncbi:MAG: hypothetical protein ACREU4_14480, partial [Burkholderiales bacterium]
VVPRALNDSAPGDYRYAVCPSCCARARLEPGTRVMRCRPCGGTFAVVWSDASWRAFEISSEEPDERTLARVRAAALQILAEAFR